MIALVRRDLRRSVSSGGATLVVAFFLLVATLFPFAIGPDAALLARIAASNAPVWLLDEPANGLDAHSVTRLEALLDRHRAGGGIALVATHLPMSMPGVQEIGL